MSAAPSPSPVPTPLPRRSWKMPCLHLHHSTKQLAWMGSAAPARPAKASFIHIVSCLTCEMPGRQACCCCPLKPPPAAVYPAPAFAAAPGWWPRVAPSAVPAGQQISGAAISAACRGPTCRACSGPARWQQCARRAQAQLQLKTGAAALLPWARWLHVISF